MAYKGFPKAMWIAGAVLLAIIVAEAIYVLSTGLEKTATVAEEEVVTETVQELPDAEETLQPVSEELPADE